MSHSVDIVFRRTIIIQTSFRVRLRVRARIVYDAHVMYPILIHISIHTLRLLGILTLKGAKPG